MAKISAFIFFSFLFVFSVTQAALADSLDVTVRARGATQEEALASAVDDAIRRSVGVLFAERTETDGEVLDEKLIRYSRGIATNYKILESASDSSGVTLTVLVTVDFDKLRENSRTLKEGTTTGGVGYRQTPALDEGQDAIADFLSRLRYENYLEAGIEDQQVDARKGLLNVNVFLKVDRKRYTDEFVTPITGIMENIFGSPEFRREVEEEYDNAADRFAAAFNVLGENYSSRSWMLPRGLYETLKRDARFWDAKKGRIQTHKRIWLHFSFLDADGAEIDRIPVHLGASNVLFFSEERREPMMPWFSMGLEASGLKNSLALTAAPRFGAMTGSGYAFYESFTQSFAFDLPEELLSRVNNVKVSLELER